ncbi:MAG TPA: LamG-like jellyroll fold domain-containing protein [Gemmataceae bacterium]
MTGPADEFDELRDLLDALCEEAITAEQVRRLEAIVLSRPEAEAFYVQYMSQYADLCHRFAGRPAAAEQSVRDRAAAVTVAPRRSVRKLVVGLVAVTAALAAGVVAAVVLWPKPAGVAGPGAGQPQAAERTDDSVAILLQAPGAVWDDADAAPRVGAPLRPGWLHLKAGAAHLQFYSGATVILQGPAEFQLVSRNRAYLTWGKLRASVPPQAQGFAIGAPNVDLVDRGTEFGLKVGGKESAEVQVFQGKVDLYDPPAGGGPAAAGPPKRAVTTGQAVRVDGPGAPRPVPPTPNEFLTARDLADRTQRAVRERQAAWAAASRALRADPSVVVYYPFEAGEAWSRTLADQARGRSAPKDGAIVGCTWVAGRWPGKQGLEFKQVSDRVRLTVPGEFRSLTMAAWVRVDALPNRFNSLFMTDDWLDGAPHWHIGEAGKIELGVQGPNKKGGVHYETPELFTPDRFGEWCHVAVVYDRDAGLVTHYVDGHSVHEEPMKHRDLPLKIGDAEIGNWNPAAFRGKYPIRHFSGCMDEFVMFSRALTEQEVEKLCDQGRPPE